MKRRVLLLLTSLIAAAMMSVGPALAHSGNDNDCDWDGHRWWHDNGGDCGDDNGNGGVNIGKVTYRSTTGPWR